MVSAPVITIDGPSGSGKGTVAGILAKRLGWNLLDSGALYRLLAFAAGNHGVALDNEALLEKLAPFVVASPVLIAIVRRVRFCEVHGNDDPFDEVDRGFFFVCGGSGGRDQPARAAGVGPGEGRAARGRSVQRHGHTAGQDRVGRP